MEADGSLAVDTVSAIDHYHQGLPFTAVGRLAVAFAPPTYFGGGAAPFTAAGRLSLIDGGVYVASLAAVRYTVDGEVLIGAGVPEAVPNGNITPAASAPDAGFTKGSFGSINSYIYVGGFEVTEVMSFGADWFRISFTGATAVLGPSIKVKVIGLGSGTLADLSGSGYSYGGTIEGAQAFMNAEIGNPLQIFIEDYDWTLSP